MVTDEMCILDQFDKFVYNSSKQNDCNQSQAVCDCDIKDPNRVCFVAVTVV